MCHPFCLGINEGIYLRTTEETDSEYVRENTDGRLTEWVFRLLEVIRKPYLHNPGSRDEVTKKEPDVREPWTHNRMTHLSVKYIFRSFPT